MAKRGVAKVFNQAQQVLAAEAETKLLDAYPLRWQDPGSFLRALEDFNGCQFWREARFHSFAQYFKSVIPNANKMELFGWQALSCCAHDPHIPELIKSGKLKVRKLCWIKATISKDNYKMWVFLAMHLHDMELCEAAKGYRQLLRKGMSGDVVFMPMWVPVADYKKYFGKEDIDIPVWIQVKERINSDSSESPTVFGAPRPAAEPSEAAAS